MLSHFNCVWLFGTLWPIACQAPLSIGFFRQEYWSGLPCPAPGDLPDSGIEPRSLKSLVLAGRGSLTLAPPSPTQKFDIGKICCGRVCECVYVCVCVYSAFLLFLTSADNQYPYDFHQFSNLKIHTYHQKQFWKICIPGPTLPGDSDSIMWETWDSAFFLNAALFLLIYFLPYWIFIAAWAFL